MEPQPHAVLVAEDEPPLVRLMQRVLERAGYQVMVAPDGEAALAAFDAHRERLDIAVLDAAIAPRGCAEILDRIGSERPSMGLVLASGDALEDGVRERLRAHAGIFLRKPFAPHALLRAVEDSLGKEAHR